METKDFLYLGAGILIGWLVLPAILGAVSGVGKKA